MTFGTLTHTSALQQEMAITVTTWLGSSSKSDERPFAETSLVINGWLHKAKVYPAKWWSYVMNMVPSFAWMGFLVSSRAFESTVGEI